MEEKDFERIGQMVAQVIEVQLEGVKDAIIEGFHHQVALERELFQKHLSLVAEGHQMLFDKLEGIEASIRQVDSKVDRVELSLTDKLNGIAADVSAHRADTEAHSGLYVVKES